MEDDVERAEGLAGLALAALEFGRDGLSDQLNPRLIGRTRSIHRRDHLHSQRQRDPNREVFVAAHPIGFVVCTRRRQIAPQFVYTILTLSYVRYSVNRTYELGEMMKIGPLALLTATNSRRSFNLASWHSRHSLTWSWILGLSFDGIWRRRPRFWRYRDNCGLQWGLVIPGATLQWSRQREMWFRDMYRRAADDRDEAERRVRKQGRLMAFLASKGSDQ